MSNVLHDESAVLRQERVQAWGRLLAVVLFVATLFVLSPEPDQIRASRLAAVTVLMSVLWLTQAIPIAATSLVPLALFPLLGIATAEATSKAYINRNVFLFLGGFVIALGIEKWGLHRRLALSIVCLIGSSPRRIVLGFMLATAFLSMWISNTASTLLMLPIGLALLSSLRETGQEAEVETSPDSLPRAAAEPAGTETADQPAAQTADSPEDSTPEPLVRLGIALMLGIAWSASLGGMTTLVGTPTNVAFAEIWDRTFVHPPHPPGGPPAASSTGAATGTGNAAGTGQSATEAGLRAPELSAGTWMTGFVPIGAVLLLCAWGVLVWRLLPLPGAGKFGRRFFRERLQALGPPRRTEILMATVFAVTAVLWVTRRAVRVGSVTFMPGWSDLLREPLAAHGVAVSGIHDSTIAMLMAVLMFFIPAGRDSRGQRQFLMDWKTAERLPWGILLLIGGGFALASAFSSTGLSSWIGTEFAAAVAGWPLWMLVGGTCLLLTFLTELTSNVATVSTLLPVLASVSVRLEIDPRLIMFPAAIATSCAFMLPIATPPNAIVFGSGRVPMGAMVRTGLVLNLVCVFVLTAATFGLLVPHFGINTRSMPAWADPPAAAAQKTPQPPATESSIPVTAP